MWIDLFYIKWSIYLLHRTNVVWHPLALLPPPPPPALAALLIPPARPLPSPQSPPGHLDPLRSQIHLVVIAAAHKVCRSRSPIPAPLERIHFLLMSHTVFKGVAFCFVDVMGGVLCGHGSLRGGHGCSMPGGQCITSGLIGRYIGG
jgi:hypothetical protein